MPGLAVRVRGLWAGVDIDPAVRAGLIANDDVLDAAVCVLAGSDFLRGDCLAPEDAAQAVPALRIPDTD